LQNASDTGRIGVGTSGVAIDKTGKRFALILQFVTIIIQTRYVYVIRSNVFRDTRSIEYQDVRRRRAARRCVGASLLTR